MLVLFVTSICDGGGRYKSSDHEYEFASMNISPKPGKDLGQMPGYFFCAEQEDRKAYDVHIACVLFLGIWIKVHGCVIGSTLLLFKDFLGVAHLGLVSLKRLRINNSGTVEW